MAVSFIDRDNAYGLRGVAMLMIIMSHTLNGYPGTHLPALHIELWGGMGTAVFFLFSGYGLTLSLMQRGRVDAGYVRAKARRLIVPWLVYWVVEVAVLLIFNRGQLSWHLLTEALTLRLHPDVENWFFKVIIATYAVELLLFRCRMSNGARVVATVVLAAGYVALARVCGLGHWWYNTILCFPLGALMAYRRDALRHIPAAVVSGTALVVMLATGLLWHGGIVFNMAFAVMAVSALHWLNLRWRWLRFVGYNSLLCYFVQVPVMDEVMMFAHPVFPLYCLLSVAGTVALVAAVVYAMKCVSLRY